MNIPVGSSQLDASARARDRYTHNMACSDDYGNHHDDKRDQAMYWAAEDNTVTKGKIYGLENY